MKEILLGTFNTSLLAYAAWFTFTLSEIEGGIKVATGVLVFFYTCLRIYKELKK